MKKFNLIIASSLILYLLLAFLCGSAIFHIKDKQINEYRIESNRIMNRLKSKDDIPSLSLKGFSYIQKVEFLDANEKDATMLKNFYKENNTSSIQIVPWYQDTMLLGYLKFTYQLPQYQIRTVFLFTELGLLLMELCLIGYLLYLKKHIVNPFYQLNELPQQLEKGHYKGFVKEEKSRFFSSYLRNLGQLQDTLDIAQKRQLELLKEKKTLLLSLSHDIKTPLNLIKLYEKALAENLYETVEEKQAALQKISEKADEIETYVEQIMKSSREEILDLPVEKGEFYLEDLLHSIVKVYGEACTLRQLKFLVHSFENRLLNGDMERSREVMENLIENALKYGDGNLLEISFYEEDFCQLIRVFNTGDVIMESELPHVFDSFYRASNSQGKSGNGLGLYICKELMRKMDGDIFVQVEKQGMAFVLVFR